LKYLEKHYLPWRKQYAEYAVKLLPNYGIKVTSRTESSHSELKSYLKNRLADLHKLYETIRQMTLVKKARYILQLKKEDRRAPISIEDEPVLEPLARKIGWKALDKIAEQFQYAKKSLIRGTWDLNCSCVFRSQFGLPCWHDILPKIAEGGKLSVEDCDRHWWLHGDMVREFFSWVDLG